MSNGSDRDDGGPEDQGPGGGQGGNGGSPWGNQRWLLALLFFGLVYLLLNLWGAGQQAEPTATVPYTQFKALVQQNAVTEVTLQGDKVTGKLSNPRVLVEGQPPMTNFRTTVPAFGDDQLLPTLEKAAVPVNVKEPAGESAWSGLIWLIPWILIIGLYIWWMRRMQQNFAGGGFGRAGDLGKFLRGRVGKQTPKEHPDVTFEDVAGQENAKKEVAELVDYLRDSDRYTRLGADVPHGVLLMGAPGTGKTLLARALAGEAGVPFYSISGSEFIEVFVGVGASRVRNLFDEAKKNAPAIIFIDELDSIGRVRGTGLGGGHDEREQTLNQILAEMDGFEGHEAVVVLAATNRPDVLDPALMRPGRFDRHIELDLPDLKARTAILKVHTRKTPIADDVDLADVARGTPGFSGADLRNLVNEAAMMAAREGEPKVTARHFEEMRERVMMGSVRSLAIEADEKHRLAVHEGGHTAVAYHLPHADPLYKVSIIPRGRALGGTQMMPEHERHTMPEDYLRDRIAVTLAGRAAEKVMLGTGSSGADDDIKKATQLARAMVARWGMSDTVGPMDARESEEHPFLGREMAQPRVISESTARMVDEAVRDLLIEEEKRARAVLEKHRKEVEKLVAELEAKESLGREAIEACLGPSDGGKQRRKKKTPAAAKKGDGAAAESAENEPEAGEKPEAGKESKGGQKENRRKAAGSE